VSPERSRINAAYLRPTTLRRWSDSEFASWIDTIAACGVDTVIAKAPAIRPAHVASCRRAGVSLVGALTCFSDHDADAAAPPALRPVDERGEPWRPMEWYAGIIPTDEAYNDALAARCRDALDIEGLDGLVFDFLRWPGHWELELRPPGRVRRSSFDVTTLRRFQDWLGPGGSIDPEDPVASARVIADDLAGDWERFRVEVIDHVAARLAALVHASGRWAGLFVIPAPDTVRRSVFGQATASLGAFLDVLLPMTFNGILGQPPTWPATIAADVGATTDRPVVPMIQLSADPVYAHGSDWGPELSPADVTAAVRATVGSPVAGVCFFPGEALADPRLTRIAAMCRATRAATTQGL
jgi:hypothetical protein